MKKSLRTALIGAGLAGLIVAGTGAAYASHTVVSVNGVKTVADVAYTADTATGVAFMSEGGSKLSCSTATIDGDIKRGAVVNPVNVIGTIDNLLLGDCDLEGIFPVDVTMTGGDITVQTHPGAAGSAVDVRITGISASVNSTTASSCSFDADGYLDATITPGGTKDATLTLDSATFIGAFPNTGFTLEVSNVVGCGGLLSNEETAGAWDADKDNETPSAFNIDSAGLVTHATP